MNTQRIPPQFLRLCSSLIGTIVLIWIIAGLNPATPVSATIPNRQPWVHQPGICPPALEGAVFGRAI
ncbi:hypothetical protein, partial [uncultured Chloroflexus sp.]|uniref:hypothetical protein n=1 Tax=uncultured Chloroflexus sp. TaxID=214040 RepID=UPI00261FF8FE